MSRNYHPDSVLKSVDPLRAGTLSDAINEQLQILDQRSVPLSHNLLHVDVNRFVDIHDQARIRSLIATRLAQASSMADRFSVAVQPDTGTYVGSYDLSYVRHPATPEDYTTQKEEYRRLCAQFAFDNYARDDPESELIYSQPEGMILDGVPYALVTRNRHLGEVKVARRIVKIGKRTTMLLSEPEKIGRAGLIDPSLLKFSQGTPRVAYRIDDDLIQARMDEGPSDRYHPIENHLYVYTKQPYGKSLEELALEEKMNSEES